MPEKETRKQKIARQAKERDRLAGKRADRAFDPIRQAIENGELAIEPATKGRESDTQPGTPDHTCKIDGTQHRDGPCDCAALTRPSYVGERPGLCGICGQEKARTAEVGDQRICDDCFYRLRDRQKGMVPDTERPGRRW